MASTANNISMSWSLHDSCLLWSGGSVDYMALCSKSLRPEPMWLCCVSTCKFRAAVEATNASLGDLPGLLWSVVYEMWPTRVGIYHESLACSNKHGSWGVVQYMIFVRTQILWNFVCTMALKWCTILKVIHVISRSCRLTNQWFESNLNKITRPVAVIKSLRFALFTPCQLL